jgi:Flp pilus assembly protein TadD
MKRFLAIGLLVAATAIAAPSAHAVGDDSPSAPGVAADPDVEAGKAAIRAKDWNAAIVAFGKVAAKDPKDANAQNFLGYAYRMSGKLDLAFKHYNEALRLDPRHRGAHEYIGEAYLMAKNVVKAEEHLAALEGICRLPCEEHADLRAKIAAYKKGNK